MLAAIALEEGKPDVAEQHALAALEIAETRRLSGLSHLALSQVVLGRVLADRGELDEADRVLTQALERVRARQDTLPVAECLLALAPVRRALKRPDEARELLAEAACIIEGSVDPGILRRRLEETTVILGRRIRRTSEADELTDRERDVLRLLDEQRTKREIGARALSLLQHDPLPYEVDLPQAGRLLTAGCSRASTRARADLSGCVALSAPCVHPGEAAARTARRRIGPCPSGRVKVGRPSVVPLTTFAGQAALYLAK